MTPEEKAIKAAADKQAKLIADAVSIAVAESQKKSNEAQAVAISEAVDKAVATALKGVKESKSTNGKDKARNKTMQTRALNLSQSTEKVGFKATEDHGKMVKGKTYIVSENIAEILEMKEIGNKCELPKKEKKK